MNLPDRDYLNYWGVDPGFTGGIVRINAEGTTVEIFDIPIHTGEKLRDREYDLPELYRIYRRIRATPDSVVGLEWPTTRLGEGAERCERFGRGKGILEAFAFILGIPYYKIAPNLWKGRLGLDGKEFKGANQKAADMFDLYYPAYAQLVRGPRGGLKDGRIDAGLIAHFLRTLSGTALAAVVEQFGENSPEAMNFVLTAGKNRRLSNK